MKKLRKPALVLLASLLVFLAGFLVAHLIHCAEVADKDQPILRLPFPRGTAVIVNQGNQSPIGRTHSYGSCLHAFDFANFSTEQPIVAAAAGRVSYVLTGALPLAAQPGFGFGNQVRVEHQNGYFTLYAHLDSVYVAVGDRVETGEALGTMGETGNAGYRHLHFSLHHGVSTTGDPPWTVPIGRLVAADLDEDVEFREIAGSAVVSTHKEWDEGNHIYGSENSRGGPVLYGSPDDSLRARLLRGRDAIRNHETVARVLKSWFYSEDKRDSAEKAEEALDRLQLIVDAEPGNRVACYWIAAAYQSFLFEPEKAEPILRRLESMGAGTGTINSWLAPWIQLRLGLIAEGHQNLEEARQRFERALSSPNRDAELSQWAQQGLERVSGQSSR